MKQRILKHKYVLSTFGISFLFMMIAFAVIGLYPFGKGQIMVIDSWHQYYPFFQELHYKLQHGESIFYSWDMGMGSNFILVMAYYAFSPIYLLSILVPAQFLREFLMFATAFKIALAGTFFSVYIKHQFKREDYTITGFGLLYAFCGFTMGYYWNVMWLDAVALFPLIILGMHRVISGKGFKLYVITLAIALISNFYIGYFVCEFILIYYFIAYFSRREKFKFGHFFNRSIQILVYSFIAIGLAAIVLLPAFRGLQLSHAIEGSKPTSFKTYFTTLEILNNLLVGVQPTVKSGLPNIFSSFIALLMLPVYYMTNRIKIKEKILYTGLLVFFIASFNINYLNYIWHAFHFPNEVPYRFAFMFSFVLLTMAYKGFENFEETRTKQIWAILIGVVIYLIVNESISLKSEVLFGTLAATALYGLVFLLYRYRVIRRKLYVILFSILILSEALLSAILGSTTTGSSSRAGYPYLGDDVKAAVQKVYNADDSFYRMEMIKWYSTNDPALYGYRGVSMFSSTVNSNVTQYLKTLGLAASPASNRYLYAASTPLVNGLLNVDYLIGRDAQGTRDNVGYSPYLTEGKVNVFKNNYPLSIGFRVDYNTYNWEGSPSNPFIAQEAFLKSATGNEYQLYTNVPISSENYVNMERTNLSNDLRYSYKNLDASAVGNAVLFFNAPETKQMYLTMYANRSYKTKVSIGGESPVEYETRRGLIIDLGVLEKGTEIKLEFEVQAANEGYFNLQAVTFDQSAWEAAYGELSDEQLIVTDFSSTKIKGHIDAKNDGFIYTSIPYELGWTVKIDGEKILTEALDEAMLMVDVEKGYHEIEFSYLPYGLKQGFFISLMALALFIFMLKYGQSQPDPDFVEPEVLVYTKALEEMLKEDLHESDIAHEQPIENVSEEVKTSKEVNVSIQENKLE
ncbi:MAG: hypothetical protein BGO41_09670 [Clostridiales bacterium 38-18]|nr:MAG: hypothetical protein BGO41_09670 [Clostridiales bacterium 38-18]